MRGQRNFESKFRKKFEKLREGRRLEKFREFITERIPLTKKEAKYKKQTAEYPEISPEKERKLKFERYLRGLDLNPEDLKGKRILDLGCGEKGEFVRECLDRGLGEIYGLDLRIESENIKEKYRNHFFKGNFEEEFPLENLDLVVAVGALWPPSSEDQSDRKDLSKTLSYALRSIKEDGEIRIFPIFKTLYRPPENRSKIDISEFERKKWQEILDDLSSQGLINYELKPINIIHVVEKLGDNPDIELEEVLMLKKKIEPQKQEPEEELNKAREQAEEAFEKGGEKE